MIHLLTTRKFTLSKRHNFHAIFLFSVVASSIILFIAKLFGRPYSFELLWTVILSAAAFVHFLYAQHEKNAEAFSRLFIDFNQRYDRLNDTLNKLVADGSTVISKEDRDCLDAYFNLCAEEYLYYTAGYIDENVWVSWRNGMSYFAQKEPIRSIWKSELNQNSYYGIKLSTIGHPDA